MTAERPSSGGQRTRLPRSTKGTAQRIRSANAARALIPSLTPPGALCIDPGRRGNNSVVECDLAKVEVAGSNPVSRSTSALPFASSRGGVAKRQGRGLQNLHTSVQFRSPPPPRQRRGRTAEAPSKAGRARPRHALLIPPETACIIRALIAGGRKFPYPGDPGPGEGGSRTSPPLGDPLRRRPSFSSGISFPCPEP